MTVQRARKCYSDDEDGRRAAAIAVRKKAADKADAKARKQNAVWEAKEAVRWGLT